jgi:hypothetical protein
MPLSSFGEALACLWRASRSTNITGATNSAAAGSNRLFQVLPATWTGRSASFLNFQDI